MKGILAMGLLSCCIIIERQERLICPDGQKFRIKKYGTGKTTVIIESGMSDSFDVWGSIPYSVSLFAHVFLHDRADTGKSDTSGTVRTVPNMAKELRSILNELSN